MPTCYATNCSCYDDDVNYDYWQKREYDTAVQNNISTRNKPSEFINKLRAKVNWCQRQNIWQTSTKPWQHHSLQSQQQKHLNTLKGAFSISASNDIWWYHMRTKLSTDNASAIISHTSDPNHLNAVLLVARFGFCWPLCTFYKLYLLTYTTLQYRID